ncbi:MAG: DUF58 domain-containing protein [Deltaproteobacteria bacterium]|nr:DUF58 domain-containing protein [Deltaproteobacteria bacterium]
MTLKKTARHILDRIPLPTQRALWVAALGIPAAMLWGWSGMLLLDVALLLLCFWDYLSFTRKESITCRRRFPAHFLQGIKQKVEIVVENPGSREVRVLVRDEPPLEWEGAPILEGVVPAGSTLVLHYFVRPEERGMFRFGDLHLRERGPLGWILRISSRKADEIIKVYPRFQPLRYTDFSAFRRMNQGLRRARWRGEGREFEALREYREGDDLKRIHWKATARLDRPIVQEYEPEANQIVMALVDTGRLMGAVSGGKTKLDHALEAVVHLAHAAVSGGDRAGMLAFSDRVVSFVPPGGNPPQVRSILEATLSIRASMVEPRYEEAFLWMRSRVRRRSLVVVFTDLLDETASENLLEAVSLLRPRHLPLCVTIRDSAWDQVLGRKPGNAREVYEQAVLWESLRQRRKAMGLLAQKGALVLDLPPERLSTETMERYLEVKRRGLI